MSQIYNGVSIFWLTNKVNTCLEINTDIDKMFNFL